MSEKPTKGLSCPKCSGMVPIPEGQVMVICPFCEMRSLVKGERGLRRYQVERRVNREAAQKAMKGFLSGKMQIARNAGRTSRVQETFLAYLPFWAKWSRLLGWVFGQEKRRSGKNTRWVAREKKVAEEMNWNGVALDAGEFGVESISLQNRPLEAFNPEELHTNGMVFEPVGSSSDAREEAEREFRTRLRSMTDLDRVAQTFIRFAKERMGLVYYPLWVVRYLYRGRAYQVVVDGQDGKVLYGKAPGSTLFRSAALVGGMAIGAFIAVDVASLMAYLAIFMGDDDSLGLLVVALGAVGVGIGLMVAGYRAFRYGEEYEFTRNQKNKRGSGIKVDQSVKDLFEELI